MELFDLDWTIVKMAQTITPVILCVWFLSWLFSSPIEVKLPAPTQSSILEVHLKDGTVWEVRGCTDHDFAYGTFEDSDGNLLLDLPRDSVVKVVDIGRGTKMIGKVINSEEKTDG